MKILILTLLLSFAVVSPSVAGQLFPPAGATTGSAKKSCPTGNVLRWKDGTVSCSSFFEGVTYNCPSGRALTGFNNGTPVCSWFSNSKPTAATEPTIKCVTAKWNSCPSGYSFTGLWDTNWDGSNTKIRCCKNVN